MTYDAIIVLSNLLDEHGELNAESQARLREAVSAFGEGLAPVMLTSGWDYNGAYDQPIALAMRDFAVQELGMAAESILSDPHSRDTVGDAYFTKVNFAVPRGWERVLLVTSQYHLARALRLFQFVYGPDVVVEGRSAGPEPEAEQIAKEQASLASFEETFQGVKPGDEAAVLEKLRSVHPYYNGEIYARI